MEIYDNKSANQLVRRVASTPLDEVLGSLHLAKENMNNGGHKYFSYQISLRNFCCEITINGDLSYALEYIQI